MSFNSPSPNNNPHIRNVKTAIDSMHARYLSQDAVKHPTGLNKHGSI